MLRRGTVRATMTIMEEPSGSAAVEVAQDRKAGLSTQPHLMRFNPDGSGGPGGKTVLLERFGAEYVRCRQRTGMFFPKFRKRIP